jgi:hypothetical protein
MQVDEQRQDAEGAPSAHQKLSGLGRTLRISYKVSLSGFWLPAKRVQPQINRVKYRYFTIPCIIMVTVGELRGAESTCSDQHWSKQKLKLRIGEEFSALTGQTARRLSAMAVICCGALLAALRCYCGELDPPGHREQWRFVASHPTSPHATRVPSGILPFVPVRFWMNCCRYLCLCACDSFVSDDD